MRSRLLRVVLALAGALALPACAAWDECDCDADRRHHAPAGRPPPSNTVRSYEAWKR